MILDHLTTSAAVWAAGTVAAILAITYCKGCCIARILRKECKK